MNKTKQKEGLDYSNIIIEGIKFVVVITMKYTY